MSVTVVAPTCQSDTNGIFPNCENYNGIFPSNPVFYLLASKPCMWVQWTSIGAVMLKKHFFKFLVIYCLIKGFKALVKIEGQLNKENPFLIHCPFWKVLPNLIKS
jgi:hypothetical protein